MKNYKSTILLLVAVAVAGLIAFSLSKKPTSEELAQQRKRLLPDFETASVQELTIEGAGARILCRREGQEGWRIVEPVGVRADRWQVEGILDKLELAEKTSATKPAGGKAWNLADFGLEPPARTITMTAAEPAGRTWTVLVGRETGVADSVYVALKGEDAVYTVKREVTDEADVTLADLRSRSLAPRISSVDLHRIAVSAEADGDLPAAQIELEKSGKDWRLTSPLLDLADDSQVRALAGKVQDYRIGDDDFVVDDPTRAAEYGLDKPLLTVTLEAEKETQTIIVSRHEEDGEARYYAMNKAELPIVRVPDTFVTDLRKSPDDMREKALADFWQDQVAEVSIDGPGGPVLLSKHEGEWRVSTGAEGEEPAAADKATVEQVLRGLKEAQVQEFVADDPPSLDPYGLGEGQAAHVTLADKDGEELGSVELGSAADEAGTFYARRTGHPAVLRLEQGDHYEPLMRGRLAFLDRVVMKEPADRADKVFTRGGPAQFECVWNAKDSRWDMTAPVKGQAEQWAVRAIVDAFAQLRVAALVEEQAADLAPYGLGEPSATVRVTYRPATDDSDAEPHTGAVLLGAETEEPATGRYACIEGDPRVFVLPDHLAGQLTANLASKLVCRADGLTGITLHKGDEERTFNYDAKATAWSEPGVDELPAATSAALQEVHWLLRNFTGSEVVDIGGKDASVYGFDRPLLVVELHEETAKGKNVFIGGQAEQGGWYAKGPATGFVVLARQSDVDKLLAVLETPAEEEPAEEAAPAGAPAPEAPAAGEPAAGAPAAGKGT